MLRPEHAALQSGMMQSRVAMVRFGYGGLQVETRSFSLDLLHDSILQWTPT
jgi:hypothetical protein